MVDTPGGAVGSAPVGWQSLGASTQYPADGAAAGTATAEAIAGFIGSAAGTSTVTGYLAVPEWDGVGEADGTSFLIGFGAWLYSGAGSVDGTSTAEAVGVQAVQGSGSVAGTSSVSGAGASLAAGTGIDRSEPYGYGGPVGTTALGQTPLGYAYFDYTGCTVYGFSTRLISQAGVAAGTSSATAIQGYIGSAAGTSKANAVPGFIGSAAGTVSVGGYLNVYGSAAGTATATAVAGYQGLANGSSTAAAVNGSIANLTGSAAGSCVVYAYQLWQDTSVSGSFWDYEKYTSGVGGALGSTVVGASPIASTDLEPLADTAEWNLLTAYKSGLGGTVGADPVGSIPVAASTQENWAIVTPATSVAWTTPATTSTTWQKAA